MKRFSHPFLASGSKNGRRLILLAFGLIMFSVALANPLSAQEVALTFDDLPAHSTLPPNLSRVDIAKMIIGDLQSAHAPKTYGFVNAGKLENVPADIEVLKMWRAAGFPLGSHTYSHMSLTANSAEAFEQDIRKNEPVLESLMAGDDWHWFRYPFLWEGDTFEKRRAIRAYLAANGYRVAQVTLDFEDYAWNAPYARCVAKNDAVAIERLKATYMSTAGEYIRLGQTMSELIYGRDIKHVLLLHLGGFETVMLPQLLAYLNGRGFSLITLEDAESDPAYQSDPNVVSKWGGTLLEQMMDATHLKIPPHAEKPFKELDSVCR
jgi:peptidoglycan/xylan/chitin deacetylase (PgdA/CDA1 family)